MIVSLDIFKVKMLRKKSLNQLRALQDRLVKCQTDQVALDQIDQVALDQIDQLAHHQEEINKFWTFTFK